MRGEYVFEKHIYVCGQYGEFGYVDRTKTKENRKIPLMPEMIMLLNKLKTKNGKGFVFHWTAGLLPLATLLYGGAWMTHWRLSGQAMRKRSGGG